MINDKVVDECIGLSKVLYLLVYELGSGGKIMNNNDRLVRLRYALDSKDIEMVEIFKLGGLTVSKDDIHRMLTKVTGSGSGSVEDEELGGNLYELKVDNQMFESFLNGLIISKRGVQEETPGAKTTQFLMSNDNRNVNNILLKKLKIALSLTGEDMLAVLEEAGVTISKSELSAVLRKEGQRNYKECGDRYARNFLKGLALKFRP